MKRSVFSGKPDAIDQVLVEYSLLHSSVTAKITSKVEHNFGVRTKACFSHYSTHMVNTSVYPNISNFFSRLQPLLPPLACTSP